MASASITWLNALFCVLLLSVTQILFRPYPKVNCILLEVALLFLKYFKTPLRLQRCTEQGVRKAFI